jgi:hypothetical protein
VIRDKPLEAFERNAAVLKRVAQGYEAASPEGLVLRRAALALLFAALDHGEAFEEFVRHADADATGEAALYQAALRAKMNSTRK